MINFKHPRLTQDIPSAHPIKFSCDIEGSEIGRETLRLIVTKGIVFFKGFLDVSYAWAENTIRMSMLGNFETFSSTCIENF